MTRRDDSGHPPAVLHDLDAADAGEAPRLGRIFPRQRRQQLLGGAVPAEEVAPDVTQLINHQRALFHFCRIEK